MKQRTLKKKVLEFAQQYPVVTVVGPRQSGKTTLTKMIFPDCQYVNLESLAEREFARTDPAAFLRRFTNKSVIIDEVQNAPQLLSEIQVVVDADNKPGRFILTGSQNFSMMNAVSQSLAGRTALCTLYPFAMDEIKDDIAGIQVEEAMWRGFYPKLFSRTINPSDELAFYVSTYLEKDVRQIENIRNLRSFHNFLRLAAGRTGQILNVSSLAADCGISPKVAFEWLSLLEASFIIKLVEPWYRNINKRLVKAPKLYFLDVGLACNLIGITAPEQLMTHPLRGALFETMVVSDFIKRRAHSAKHDDIHYYRDSNHNEIDLVVENGVNATLYEIKSGETFSGDWTATMERLAPLFGENVSINVIYGGSSSQKRSSFNLYSWKGLP